MVEGGHDHGVQSEVPAGEGPGGRAWGETKARDSKVMGDRRMRIQGGALRVRVKGGAWRWSGVLRLRLITGVSGLD